jgi:L-asparagine transporter-like permease
VLTILFPDSSFTLMVAISMFGTMFTWFMIFVTHLYFRRAHRGMILSFRMWGYPYLSLTGAAFMVAILLTTAFTTEFRMTLVYGLPVLAVLWAAWRLRREPIP